MLFFEHRRKLAPTPEQVRGDLSMELGKPAEIRYQLSMQTDPRIDAYIAKAAPFAQPVLTHFRALVHRALPQAEEGIKWSMPAFMIGGKNVAGMAAFKAHCAIMIHGEGRMGEKEGMGGYGKVTALSDLPDDAVLEAGLREAAQRVATGGTAAKPKAKSAPRAEIAMPDDFAEALDTTPGAREKFEAFPPGARREYLAWIVGAKRPETRAKRIATACAQSAEGKKMNWKYGNC
ncbi:MAG: YdeI family protein [Cypionkella sp.]